MPANARWPLLLLAGVALALAWSAWRPYDIATWWAEVMPVLIGVPILVLTFRRHPLTPLLRRQSPAARHILRFHFTRRVAVQVVAQIFQCFLQRVDVRLN